MVWRCGAQWRGMRRSDDVCCVWPVVHLDIDGIGKCRQRCAGLCGNVGPDAEEEPYEGGGGNGDEP